MQNLRKTNETGRSMVEMLGVLAIIGVLSAGGVYGYGVAMKKHKANELLHQASMLATTISAQAMTNDGKLPETITSFGNSNYGTFSTSATDTLGGKGFAITISEMDSAVCKQMEKMAGGMVQGASCSGTTLTLSYYKNLATNDEEGAKSPTGGSGNSSFNPDGATEDDGSDCSADTKLGSECQVCIKGSYQDSDAKCEPGQICVDGMCKTPADSEYTGCTRNSDCKGTINGINCDAKTCYCNYFDYYNDDMRSGSCTEGPNKGSGVCMEATYKDTTVDNDGIAGKLSNDYMDWFSAKNFCQAVGGSMISLKGSLCTGSGYKWDCDWETLKKTGGKLSARFWWTKDLTSSCAAFGVNTELPSVYELSRYGSFYALCE